MSSGTRTYIKLLPILIPALVIVGGGVSVTFLQSLGFLIPALDGPVWFRAYGTILKSPWFYETFGYSAYVGFFSAAIALFIGTILGYTIWRLPLGAQRFAVVYKIPLILPHLTVAFLTLVLFSRSGVISSFFYKIGAISGQDQFPRVLFAGNGFGLILSYVYKEVPFVVLMTLAVYKRIDERLLVTARNLGAGRAVVLRRVVLPHIYPTAANTFIILFLYAFGAFDIPFLLSESRPQMLSIYVYNTYFKRDLSRRPEVMATLFIMFVASILLIYLYSRIVRRIGNTARWA